MADSQKLKKIREDLNAAVAERDRLASRATEIPTLKRQAVERLANTKTAFARGGVKREDVQAARSTLHDLRDEEDTLPHELLEARRRVLKAQIAVHVMESQDALEEVSAAWDLVQRHREQREHYEALEGEAMGQATMLEGRSFERQRRAQEARQALNKLDKEAERLVEQEAIDEGLQPRARPASRGREVVMDTLR